MKSSVQEGLVEKKMVGKQQNGSFVHGKPVFDTLQDSQIEDMPALVASLKACAQRKDLYMGFQLHADVLRCGLLGKSSYVSNTLVSMYAKCGALLRARHILRELPVQNVVSWSALISGYAQQGYGEEALTCFELMQHEGLHPNAVTFIGILKACGSMGAVEKGGYFHEEIARLGLLGTGLALGNALVDMYAKCGALVKAQEVLEELSIRDVVSWSTLIAGYSQHGKGQVALHCFERMQSEGILPDEVTYASLLKACGSVGALEEGEELHEEIARQGLLRNSVALGNALVDMYAKCGALAKSKQVLEELPVRDIVSWSTLIAGYAQHGKGQDALDCFEKMQQEGLAPNVVTFVCILKACAVIGAIDKGEQIHDEIVQKGFLGRNAVLGCALVDMYAKFGYFAKAQQLLEELPIHDVVPWNALLAGYAQQGEGEKALESFELMRCKGLSPNEVTYICILKACGTVRAIKKGILIHDEIATQGLLENNIVLGTALVDMYAKCGALVKAQKLHDELPEGSVVSWSALITGYVEQGQGQDALQCFDQMQNEGLFPDAVTYGCILKACGGLGVVEKGEQIHEEISKQGLLGKDIALGNALVDMYAKCGAFDKARQVLEELPFQDMVSWSALIAGYVQRGRGEEALNCFKLMQCKGLSPDEVTYSSILKACGSMGAVDKGEQIHDEIAREGLLEDNIVLSTALVDMYAKCGALSKARRVLNELSGGNVVSWSALIAGYAQQGSWHDALNCLERMQQKGLLADAVTLSSVLNACSHAGLVDEGETCFTNMITTFRIAPELEHYACMVDLFGRAGHFDKAIAIIQRMPCDDYPVIWSALLGACRKWEEVKVGRWAFDHAVQLNKTDPAPYLSMVYIYTAAGLAEEAGRIEAMRVENKALMKPGSSWWIDSGENSNLFLVR